MATEVHYNSTHFHRKATCKFQNNLMEGEILPASTNCWWALGLCFLSAIPAQFMYSKSMQADNIGLILKNNKNFEVVLSHHLPQRKCSLHEMDPRFYFLACVWNRKSWFTSGLRQFGAPPKKWLSGGVTSWMSTVTACWQAFTERSRKENLITIKRGWGSSFEMTPGPIT